MTPKQHSSDSTNHSLLPENERNFGGNQISCSLCPSSFFFFAFFLFLLLFCSFSLSLHSSLFTTKHYAKNRATNKLRGVRNVIWRTAVAQHQLLNSQHPPTNCTECCHVCDGSSLSSLLFPPSFPPPEKNGICNFFKKCPARDVFHYNFI